MRINQNVCDLGAGVLNWEGSDAAPQGAFGNDWRYFWFSYLGRGATGFQWVEVRDVAKHPMVHNAAPTTRNCLAPNISAQDETPCQSTREHTSPLSPKGWHHSAPEVP